MLLLLSGVACTADGEGTEERSSTPASGSESPSVESSAPVLPNILGVSDVRTADGSPPWCADVIGPAVRQLPSALDRLGEPDWTAAVADALTAAADELATLNNAVPQSVRTTADEAQSALRRVAADSLDPEALTALADAFSRLDQETQPVCEYTE